MSKNSNLITASKVKNDEFYTQYSDIEKEVSHYKEQFYDKVVYCNCDDPEWSNFWKFFKDNFREYHLKGLISTHYEKDGSSSYALLYDGISTATQELAGNGDFSSDECIDLLKQSDICVTNPPFSLWRQLFDILMEHKKSFLLVGNLNAVTYNNVFPYILNKTVSVGYNHGSKKFIDYANGGKLKSFGNIAWFTTLNKTEYPPYIPLVPNARIEEYPKYDGYDAVDVKKVSMIPDNYMKIMGVPLSFITKYNPSQFEIVGMFNHGKGCEGDLAESRVNGKLIFKRLAVRRI